MGRQAYWPTIESCRRLLISDIAGNDLLLDGRQWDSQMTWQSGFIVRFECRLQPDRPDLRQLRLQYQIDDSYGETHQIDECLLLKRIPQPFGGYRWCFICPSTNRRCRVLYQPPGATRFRSRWGFRCRLQYQSQRLAPMSRYQHGAARTAERVLREGPPEWQSEYVDYDFPPKPPWMRWSTYNRLDEKAQAYEKASEAELEKRAGSLLQRLGMPPDAGSTARPSSPR